MTNYTPELNFLTEFSLSRKGMIKEVEAEFDIVRLIMVQQKELGEDYKDVCDRIMVMPLRKLLFENQHNSILLELCPTFSMPPTRGFHYTGVDKLNIELAPYMFVEQSQWISLSDWGQQIIAYYDKTATDLPNAIPTDTFLKIKNKLKNGDRTSFESYFVLDDVIYEGEISQMYVRKNPEDTIANSAIFDLMDKAGYYKLTLYDFIKHLSDKRGAHIDFGLAPLISVINGHKDAARTPSLWLALQMIYAAKKQIPELADYWPEMDGIIEDLTEE